MKIASIIFMLFLCGCHINKNSTTPVLCDNALTLLMSKVYRDKNNILVLKDMSVDYMGNTKFENETMDTIQIKISKNIQCYKSYNIQDIIRILGKPYYKKITNDSKKTTYFHYFIKTHSYCVSTKRTKKFKPIDNKHETNFSAYCGVVIITFENNYLAYFLII